MTLLHQAAQKAVEAHYKELGDAWIAFDGSPGTAKRVNFALGMLGFAIDALVAQMSALQQQPEPVALTLSEHDVHFLACRLRRLFEYHKWPLPEFAANDASLIGIAGSCIGGVLAQAPPALQHQEVPREPVAQEPECKWPVRPLKKVQVTMPDGSSALLVPERAYFSAWAVQELENSFKAASPSTTRQQEVGSGAARDVLAERARQISAEGWTPEHDDEHAGGQMADAAAAYALEAAQQVGGMMPSAPNDVPPGWWPWDWKWWKPKDARSNLVRAGALILAEIERLDRAAAPSTPEKAREARAPSDAELLEAARGEVAIYDEGATVLDRDTMLRVLRAVARRFPDGVPAAGQAPQRGDWRTWDVRGTDGVPASRDVQAAYKELGDAWLAYTGAPGTAKRVNLALGMLGIAIDAPGVAMLEPTDDMAMAFHRATTDGAIGSEDVETIKAGLRAVFAAYGVTLPPKAQP